MASRSKGHTTLKILLVIFILIALCSGGFLLYQQMQINRAVQEQELMTEPEPTADNPIDFDALKQENPDIYAWLDVPGTNVNYPVLQHPENDAYYLVTNIHHERSIEGAIYTELANSKEFDDSVTVIYGHNIRGGIMFNTLHEFEDPIFFDEHRYFYIYMPGHILTYEIVAAAGYDDYHILNTQNLADPAVLEAYFASILATDQEQKNVREGSSLDQDSKIVQLSTCNYTHSFERYVVTGLLVDDQKTK